MGQNRKHLTSPELQTHKVQTNEMQPLCNAKAECNVLLTALLTPGSGRDKDRQGGKKIKGVHSQLKGCSM